MADAPGFDANAFGSTPPRITRNRVTTDVYEPGSTFKLVTVAGTLSDRLVTPQTSFVLPGSIAVADRVIHDAEERGTETMSVAKILSHSSNVGAITLAEKLGKDRLSRWIARFGFGRATGVGFPGESAGFVLPPDKWSGSTIGNVPIGQGIAVTPVQMAAAYAAIANRGVWVRPHLVRRIQGKRPPHVRRRRIVSRGIAAELNAMLQNVVVGGTGTYAAVPGYKVAGKTGTAQKPDAHGGYSSSAYVASFVGMVPASKPRLVILVTVDEPHGQIWGGVVAAPAFAQIAGTTCSTSRYRPTTSNRRASLEACSSSVSPRRSIRRASSTPRSAEIADLAYDTRAVVPGALFFCVRGQHADGHLLAPEAAARGAAALVVERELELQLPQLIVADTRRAMAPRSGRVLRRPEPRARRRRRHRDGRQDDDGLPGPRDPQRGRAAGPAC